jgi:RNA polymerase sigma-70 factor, ECF subfamily
VNVRVVGPFEEFVGREQQGLVAVAVGLTGNVADAQEVVQDVLTDAARRWEVISRYESPVAWARRAVVNRSMSVLRRRWADARRLARLREVEGREEYTLPPETAQVWDEVRRLPRRQAQAVTLRSVFGMSIQEIAQTLEITKATAQVHLDRGLKTLRERGVGS